MSTPRGKNAQMATFLLCDDIWFTGIIQYNKFKGYMGYKGTRGTRGTEDHTGKNYLPSALICQEWDDLL